MSTNSNEKGKDNDDGTTGRDKSDESRDAPLLTQTDTLYFGNLKRLTNEIIENLNQQHDRNSLESGEIKNGTLRK